MAVQTQQVVVLPNRSVGRPSIPRTVVLRKDGRCLKNNSQVVDGWIGLRAEPRPHKEGGDMTLHCIVAAGFISPLV